MTELIKYSRDCIFCGKATSNLFIEKIEGRICSACGPEKIIEAADIKMITREELKEELKKAWPDFSGYDKPKMVCPGRCCKCDVVMRPDDLAAYELKHGRIVGNICKDCWRDEDE